MKQPSVFLSHCSSDKIFAREIALRLQKYNIKVWIDEAEIKIGDSLIEKIQEGIYESEYLAVILTKKSVESEWVKREVEIAMNIEIHGKKVKVLPIKKEECAILGFLVGKLYADFTNPNNYETELTKIIDRIKFDSKSNVNSINDNLVYNIEPDELEQFIIEKFPNLNFKLHKRWGDDYYYVDGNIESNEKQYFFWNIKKRRLIKYTKEIEGVRYYGPFKISLIDKQFIKNNINLRLNQNSKKYN